MYGNYYQPFLVAKILYSFVSSYVTLWSYFFGCYLRFLIEDTPYHTKKQSITNWLGPTVCRSCYKIGFFRKVAWFLIHFLLYHFNYHLTHFVRLSLYFWFAAYACCHHCFIIKLYYKLYFPICQQPRPKLLQKSFL